MMSQSTWRSAWDTGARALEGEPELQLHVYGAEQRERVAPIWQAVEERFGGGGLASSWAWTETWLRHYGDAVPHRFVVAYDRGHPAGIALLTRGDTVRRGPITLRSLHVGTAGEPDGETVRVEYNRLLVDPARRTAFAGSLLRMSRAIDGRRCHLLMLDGFPADELKPFADALPGLELQRRVCHVADLAAMAAAGQSVQDALRRHTAAKIRRTAKRLEERYGPLAVEWATDEARALAIYDELVGLHQERWTAEGERGAFASARFTAFHRDLIRELLPQGRVLVARVTAGDQTVGCDYGFIERNRVLAYQWGLTRFDDQRLSPGLTVGALVMQAALERGLAEYDWLAGDVLYKRELATTQRELVWASKPMCVPMRLLDGAVRATQRIQGTLARANAYGAASAA